MKKIDNQRLRIFGIVLSMFALALLLRPLIAMLFGHPLIFSFFGLFEGISALIISIIMLIVGLVIVSITKPLEGENK